MTQLTDNLFVGSLDDAFDDRILSKVTHILNVAAEIDIRHRLHHNYYRVRINDDDENDDVRFVLDECVEYIHEAISQGGKVLVHCLEGVSRSVCVCIAYLCYSGVSKDFQDAYEYICKIREVDVYPLYQSQTEDWINRRSADWLPNRSCTNFPRV
jgi:protein-tyrosine phosphatase